MASAMGLAAGRLLIAAPTRRELGGLRPGNGRSQRIATTAIGHEAGSAFEAILDAERPSAVLSLGFAGGLAPQAGTGDIVVCDRIVADGYAPINLDASLGRHILGEAGAAPNVDTLLTVGEPLLTVADKRRARAASGAAVVDMEGYALASLSNARGVPFVAVRVVLDEAEQALPAFIGRIVADGGGGEIRHTLRALASNPLLLRQTPALAWRASVAGRAMRRAVRAIVPALTAAVSTGPCARW